VWLCTVVALGVTALTWPKRRTLLMGVLTLAAAGSFFVVSDRLGSKVEEQFGRQETVDFRIEMAQVSWAVIREHPVTGVGFNRFQEETAQYRTWVGYSHNTLLSVFAELGLVGFLPYLTIFSLFGIKFLSIYWRHPSYRAIIGVLWGATAAYGGMMILVDLRVQLYLNALFFTLWAIIPEIILRHAERQGQGTNRRMIVNFV
jgi:O-antigen ligase